MNKRIPVVVDTNVLLAANGHDPEWKKISSVCANRLTAIKNGGKICVDSHYLIVGEYGNKLSTSRQSPGDMFFLWVAQNLKNSKFCEQVDIEPDHAKTSFGKFPKLACELAARIDPSDRKFIAVAHAHPQKPQILQATDSKWIGWKKGLAAAGIQVDFVDEKFLHAYYVKKMGQNP